MGTPRATTSGRRLRRIGLTIGLAASLAVLPMPVRADQTDEPPPDGPIAESPVVPENPVVSENPVFPENPIFPEDPAVPEEPAVPGGPAPGSPAPESPESPAPQSPTPQNPTPRSPTAPVRPRPPAPPPVPAAIRILPLGDSITHGTGSSDRSGYRPGLYRALTAAGVRVDLVGSQRTGRGADTDHEGHPGWRIDQVHARLGRWIPAADPDVVLLDIGTNDYVQRHDTGNAPARLARLVDRIHALAPHAHIVMAKLLVISGDRRGAGVRELNAAVPRIAAARRAYVSVADMSRISAANTTDGVHPTDAGYRQMTHQWLQALRRVLPGGRAWPATADPFPVPAVSATAARTAAAITVTVRLTGRLTAVDLGGVTVRLRFHRSGTRVWTGLGTVRTDARGTATYQRRITAGGHISAEVVSGRAAGRRSAAVAVRASA